MPRIKEILRVCREFHDVSTEYLYSYQWNHAHRCLADHPTVRNRLNRPPTRRDCDNVWAPLKFNDCLAWPLTSNSNRMLSLLAMLKLVTLKGCFHHMQRNAEQQRVKYYRNKRHGPTFKPALSGLPVHDSIKDWTVSTAQAIRLHGVYKYGLRLHPLHQKRNRRQRCRRFAKYSTCATGLHFCQYIYIYNCIAYLLSMSIPFPAMIAVVNLNFVCAKV